MDVDERLVFFSRRMSILGRERTIPYRYMAAVSRHPPSKREFA